MTCSYSQLSLTLGFCLLISASEAAANTLWAVPFYKSPDALFTSGQTHIKKLLSTQIKSTEVKFYRVKKGNRQFWIGANDVVRDLHVSSLVYDLKAQKEVPVTGFNEFQIQVNNDGKYNSLGFDQVIPVFTDLGRGILIQETALRASNSWKSDSLTILKGGEVLKIQQFNKEWIEVSSISQPSLSGFLPTGSLITKFDFAAFVYIKDGWSQAKFRQGPSIILKDGRKVDIDQISALITQGDLLISRTQNDDLKYRETFKLVETSFETWIESDLPGHGKVFWKQQSETQKALLDQQLSTEELLERPIYSMSFHPKYPHIGLVSAQGIYLTSNGQSWKKIDQFESQNWPVLITPEGRLYIGDQMSNDWGKTFQHYFKWSSLASELSSMGIDSHKGLKMASLKIDPKGILNMSIQAGSKVLRLARRPIEGYVDRWEPQ